MMKSIGISLLLGISAWGASLNACCEETTWYLDADRDGYGDPGTATTACTAPEGYVASSSDCDDGDASVHPGALERCDGRDEDCDGVADDGCSSTCTTLASELEAAYARVSSCEQDRDCTLGYNQLICDLDLVNGSCGAMPVTVGADLSEVNALLEQWYRSSGCGELVDCDCNPPKGAACEAGRCVLVY